MLTITDLMTVLAFCATFYSLGYMHGKRDAKTQKQPPKASQTFEQLFCLLDFKG